MVLIQGNQLRFGLFNGYPEYYHRRHFLEDPADKDAVDEPEGSAISVTAIHVDHSGKIFMAGEQGSFEFHDGTISAIVGFTYPEHMDQQAQPFVGGIGVRPQELGRFHDGAFLIGERHSGLYLVQRGEDGDWVIGEVPLAKKRPFEF